MHLLLIAAVIQAVSANETWADEERMNTWLGNILNGYEAFERETVTISAAANDGMTNELESFGYESNIIVVEIYHGASWYFGDITYSNGISSPNTGVPGTDLQKLGQTSIVENIADGLFYGYAAFVVPDGSEGGDDYAMTIKVFHSDATVPDIDHFEVSVLTTVVQATSELGVSILTATVLVLVMGLVAFAGGAGLILYLYVL